MRPQREPHYNLLMVFCPRCRNAAVRRPHPVIRRWRDFVRTGHALWLMAWHVALILVLLAVNILAACGFTSLLLPGGSSDPLSWEDYLVMTYLLLMQIATGAWLTVGFAHIRWWKVWLGWALVVGFFCSIKPVNALIYGSPNDEFTWNGPIRVWLVRLAMIVALMLLATLGMPVGRWIQKMHARHRQHRWRKRRRKFRRIRSTA